MRSLNLSCAGGGQPDTDATVLHIQGLTAVAGPRRVPLLQDVSLAVARGTTLGVVGESGSGKSMTLNAVLGLLPRGVQLAGGQIQLNGIDLTGISERDRRRIRGRQVAMIPQDPLTSLNPVIPIGRQVAAPLVAHRLARGRRRRAVVDLLRLVGLPAPESLLRQYPHQLSGGMRQRVASAVALAAEPTVVLADEPTTSLDPTIQLQFLETLRTLQQKRGLTLVFVTHDFSILPVIADRIAVMYLGRVVEEGPVADVRREPAHPYTRLMINLQPDQAIDRSRPLSTIEGQPPRPSEAGRGCAFAPRCPSVKPVCRSLEPPPTVVGTRTVSCWIHDAS